MPEDPRSRNAFAVAIASATFRNWCRPTKAFSFRILDGRIDGPRFAGSVDPQGNLTGVFGEGSALSDVAGRLSPGEGSGTWRMQIGCSGRWSVARM